MPVVHTGPLTGEGGRSPSGGGEGRRGSKAAGGWGEGVGYPPMGHFSGLHGALGPFLGW